MPRQFTSTGNSTFRSLCVRFSTVGVIAATMAGQPNNSWNMSDSDDDLALELSCDFYSFIVYTLIMGTLIVGGVGGNSLAFVVFWKDSIKTTASFLFQSLALVDTALLLLVTPIYPIDMFVSYTGWLRGYSRIRPYILVYIYPVSWIAQTASIWVVVLLAVNRYIAVCFPLKALRWCTISKVRKQLAVVLLFAVLYNLIRFAENRAIYKTNDNGTKYTIYIAYTKLGDETLYHILYNNVMYLIFLLGLPISTLTVLNIRLMKALKTSRRNRMEMLSRRQQHDNHVTFVLIVIIIVFIICQLPAFVNQVMWNFAPYEAIECGHYQFYLRHVANTLVVLNSAVNFVIYAVFNKRFRHVLAQTVHGSACRKSADDGAVRPEDVPR